METKVQAGKIRHDISLLTDFDLHLFNEGTHYLIYEKMGAHPINHDGQEGYFFAVWAPNAESVSVIGDFNHWDVRKHKLAPRGSSGVWEGFIPGVSKGQKYKFHIQSRYHGYRVDKADPVGFLHERPPATASILWDLNYSWQDTAWMQNRKNHHGLDKPLSIYEVHLGSWMRMPEKSNRWLSYREIAPRLVEYVSGLGFTHLELLPIMEHPFYGSWGYQTTGYFAPTSRYGTPQDFMYLVDLLHQNNIGVILDWVPSHFPGDEHGLVFFDGTHLYEHADMRKGFHPDWNSYIFNYGRHEVCSFLISSAFFWLKKYHVDGLRVDAVASMLYLDYSRKPGEWIPNKYGGHENLEAIEFLRRLNQAVYSENPDVFTVAEESTAWPMVSRPVYLGGLGFGWKWDMGWMHDTLFYFSKDPIYRKHHHGSLTFRPIYAWSENFILPLSHDEVVYGKGSLLNKMPGDIWQKFANLRLLLTYQWITPGKKLLFMGGEFGQWREWNHECSLDWHLLNLGEHHKGLQKLVKQLNQIYKNYPALFESDTSNNGFEWVDCHDVEQSTLSFIRQTTNKSQTILAAFNFTPVPRFNVKIGVPKNGFWKEIFNSDATEYGGSGIGNFGGVSASADGWHYRPFSVNITLPPLAAVLFVHHD